MQNSSNTIGFIETRGMTALISALDNILKGANIKLLGYQRNGSAYLTAALQGNDDDVLTALKIGKESVNNLSQQIPYPSIIEDGLCQLISTHIISNPMVDLIEIFFNKTNIEIKNKDNALGFVDARGMVSLVAAADIMTKSAAVEIAGYYKLGSGRLSLLVCGKIDDLEYAIKEGLTVVKQHGKLISHCIIARPSPELIKNL